MIRESSDCLGTVEVGRSAKVKLIVYHEYRYTKKLNMEIRLSFTVTLQGENISLFIFSIRFLRFFFFFFVHFHFRFVRLNFLSCLFIFLLATELQTSTWENEISRGRDPSTYSATSGPS